MKRPRPYIPFAVRLIVAMRQLFETGRRFQVPEYSARRLRPSLVAVLSELFCNQKFHLDHDPALINRKYNARTGKYTPDANDPDYLVYRTEQAHDTKTRIVGEHGQYSDLALRRKNKRIARNRDRNRPRAKIKSRKTIWPKRQFGRKKNERARHSKSTKQAATRLPNGSL